MEGAFILENDSFINGYNSTLGGEGTLGKLQTQENKDIISKCTSSRNANSRWYNNGSTNRFSAEHPMDNYVLGRINQKPTTDGVFPSAAKAAIHYGIAPCTISNWVKKYPEEFYYTTKENT